MRFSVDTTSPQYHGGVNSSVSGDIEIKQLGSTRVAKARTYTCQAVGATSLFGAHSHSLPNLLRALNERVFNVVDKSGGGLRPTPKPKDGAWIRMSESSRRLAHYVRESAPHASRLTAMQFIDQCPAHKRALYTRASEELASRGWSRRDAQIKPFVKFEKLCFKERGPKSDPVPRLIQPRSPVFNVALGRYTRKIESDMYKAISREWDMDDDMVVMKGISVEEIGSALRKNWDYFEQPVAVGLDASRFDQHISQCALRWEHAVYNRVFNDPELRALLKLQLVNCGTVYVDGHRVKYQTDGCRMSGDMNTSLGNCMIMSCLVRLYCREKKVEARLANNGDDCLVFMDRRSLAKFMGGLGEWFTDFGFTMEVEKPVYVFERCEFCQTRPVFTGSEWVMVRTPENALAKDLMALGVDGEVDYKRWVTAVGKGGLALYGDMPIYGALYRRMASVGAESNITRSLLFADSGLSYKTRSRVGHDTTDECRLSFYRAFGVHPDEQHQLEEFYSGLSFDKPSKCPGVGWAGVIRLDDQLQ